MKVSFFHLGAAYAYIEPYLRSLGLDVVVPPFSSRHTLNLGTRFCPEMICTPCIHIPILSLSFDEQTSHTGLVTRLEAFVDLLWQRARKATRQGVAPSRVLLS